MNCNYKVKITDIQNKYQFKILCKGGANSTNVNDIYNLLPTTTNENTNITISNTADIKAKSITIKGNTTQHTTTGKNKLDLTSYTSQTQNGITVSPTFDNNMLLYLTSSGTFSSITYFNINNNIKLQASTQYTLSPSGASGAQFRLREYDSSNTQLSEYFASTSGTTFTTKSNTDHAVLQIVFYTTVSQKFYPQIELGSTVTSYEPYTNGASPNPSYPQDVINVSGLNTITVSNSDNSKTKDFIINFGDLEFCKIGTYQDYLYKENNKWYKFGAIGKTVLKDTQTYSYSSYFGAIMWTDSSIADMSSNTEVGVVCNKAVGISPLALLSGNGIAQNNSNNRILIKFDGVSSYNTDTLAKQYFGSNNYTVYYVLATPTITEITDTTLIKQLNNISNNIRTFEGGTNISSTSDGANPIINIITFNKLS